MDDVHADWQQWFDRHGPALTLFARQRVGSYADAEDVVQSAFVRFWKNRKTARDPLTYLYSCVASVANDLHRSDSRRRERERKAWFIRPPDTNEEPAFEPNEIEQAMSTLPEEQRDVIVLKVWGGLTFKAVAEVLSIPANTAASRYRYAIESLKSQLSQEAAS